MEKSQLDQLDQLDPDSPPSAPQWWRDGGGAEKTRQSFSWSPLERGRRARDKPAACLRGAGGGKRGWRLGVADGCETPTRKSIGPRAARRAALASRVGGPRAPPCLGSASVSLLPPPLPGLPTPQAGPASHQRASPVPSAGARGALWGALYLPRYIVV